MPADGTVIIQKLTNAQGQYLSMFTPLSLADSDIVQYGTTKTLTAKLWVQKGTIITINYTAAGATSMCRFIYDEGAY